MPSEKRTCLACKRERLSRYFLGTQGQICASCRPTKAGRGKTRLCTQCKRNRQERFYSGPQGRVCVTCQKKTRKRTSRAAHVTRTYGVARDDYESLFELQGGVCAICKGKRTTLDVDHDHSLEHLGAYAVRGLLCARCNRKLLPASMNDPEILRAAADYLENPPARALF